MTYTTNWLVIWKVQLFSNIYFLLFFTNSRRKWAFFSLETGSVCVALLWQQPELLQFVLHKTQEVYKQTNCGKFMCRIRHAASEEFIFVNSPMRAKFDRAPKAELTGGSMVKSTPITITNNPGFGDQLIDLCVTVWVGGWVYVYCSIVCVGVWNGWRLWMWKKG